MLFHIVLSSKDNFDEFEKYSSSTRLFFRRACLDHNSIPQIMNFDKTTVYLINKLSYRICQKRSENDNYLLILLLIKL